MNMPQFYDRQGNEITRAEWAGYFETETYRVVKQTDFGEGLHLSTVWLGIDHSWGLGPPLIFETMLFGPKGSIDLQERYSTEQEAIEGHDAIIARLGFQ